MTDPLKDLIRGRASPSGSTTCPASGSSTGSLATLIRDSHVVGVTTNPTIFQKAISGSDDLRRADPRSRPSAASTSARRFARSPPTTSARRCDVFRPAYDASDGVDGRVSIEVDPRLAHETERTIAEARALWWLVDRPNLFIKIPATPERRAGDRAGAGRGHQRQRHADLLPRALRRGDRRLPGRPRAGAGGRPRPVPARLGRVVLRLPGRHRGRHAAGQDRHRRGEGAARQGRGRQRPARLQAVRGEVRHRPVARACRRPGRSRSGRCGRRPSTKDPAYDDTMYVVDLVAKRHRQHDAGGDDATRSPTTASSPATRSGPLRDAQQVLDDLAALGIDYDDVVEVLEDEGVEKFDASWTS